MGYKYSDNTLIHSIGFNFARLESILKYGILSSKKAKEKNISFARNYNGYNFTIAFKIRFFITIFDVVYAILMSFIIIKRSERCGTMLYYTKGV